METKLYRSIEGEIEGTVTIATKCSLLDVFEAHTAYRIADKIADAIATRYVEEFYGEIVAKLDQNAIANLAIAEASKKIAEEIQRQPNVFHSVEKRTEVYQRGILGGIRRVV